MDSFMDNVGLYTSTFLFLLFVFKNVSEVQKNSKTDKSFITLVISLSVFIALFPVALITLAIFAIYREIISCILKIKYGPKFLGLVRGSDAVHTSDDPSNSVTHILAIFEYDHERCSENIFEVVKQTSRDYMMRYLHKLPKFQSLFLKCMGYSYMLKENVTLDECFKKMKTIDCQNGELDKTKFMELLSDCYNSPLPRNETIFWDLYVGTQPIKWNENAGRNQIKYYPVLFRNHHCIADGVALLKLWAGVFADKENIKLVYCKEHKENYSREDQNYRHGTVINLTEEMATFCKHALKLAKLFLVNLYLFLVAPASLYVNLVLKARDRNILHGRPLSGKEILALNAEESGKYFLKVKKIKNKIPGTSFPEVVLAAFSASLEDYFQRNSSSIPMFITTLIPLVSGSHELHHLLPGRLDVKDVQFQNSYSVVLLDLPIFMKNQGGANNSTPLINRLKLLKEQTKILKNSVDYQVNYLMMNVVCSLLPQPLVRLLLGQSHCTATASIMPGSCKLSFGGGVLSVADCAFWVPHLKNIGVSFSALTYDNRLQVGLGADKALIPDQISAQNIVDGVYKYLDLIEEELEYAT